MAMGIKTQEIPKGLDGYGGACGLILLVPSSLVGPPICRIGPRLPHLLHRMKGDLPGMSGADS